MSATVRNLGGGGGKQPSIISVDASATVSNATPTATKAVTITQGDGTLSATSSDTSVATVTVSGSNVVITGVGTGSATITVSLSETANYYGVSATIAVTANIVDFLTDWLTAGGLTPSSYADLDAVLADEVAIRRLFTIHDAVDVIVDEVSTISSTDLTKIFNNDYVAKWINLRDYALDTLYANSTIAGYMDTADKYFYGEWIITDNTTTPATWGAKGNVPVMTSDTAPYGEAFADSNYTGRSAYQAFNGDLSSSAWIPSTGTGHYCGYKFTNPVKAKKAFLRIQGYGLTATVKFQASNDNSTWVDISESIFVDNTGTTVVNEEIDLTTDNFYLYYRIYGITSLYVSDSSFVQTYVLQFYGREMKVSVPTMTSNTTPYGEAFESNYQNTYRGWKAFNGTNSDGADGWISYGSQEGYVGYKFANAVCIKRVWFENRNYSDNADCRIQSFKIQASNDGTTWTDLTNTITNDSSKNASLAQTSVDINNSNSYLYYRLYSFTTFSGQYAGVGEMQFFGFDYSEYDWDSVKPRHYIYDHGLELEGLTGYANNGIAEKRVNNLYVAKTITNASGGGFTTNQQIDLTNYSNYFVKLDNIAYDSSNAGYWANINVGSDVSMVTTTTQGSAAYKWATGEILISLDISSIDGEYFIAFTQYTGATRITYATYNEMWLE